MEPQRVGLGRPAAARLVSSDIDEDDSELEEDQEPRASTAFFKNSKKAKPYYRPGQWPRRGEGPKPLHHPNGNGVMQEDEHARTIYRRSCLAQKLFRAVMELNNGILSQNCLSIIALLSKRMLHYRRKNTTGLKGNPNDLLPILTKYPRVKHLRLVIPDNKLEIKVNLKAPRRLCPQLEELTLVITTYQAYTIGSLVLLRLFQSLGPLRKLKVLDIQLRPPQYVPAMEAISVVQSIIDFLLYAPSSLTTVRTLHIRGLTLGNATHILATVLPIRPLPSLQSLSLGPYDTHRSAGGEAVGTHRHVATAFFKTLTSETVSQLQSLHLYGHMAPLNHASPLNVFFDQPWSWPSSLRAFHTTDEQALQLLPYSVVPFNGRTSSQQKNKLLLLGLSILAHLPPTYSYPATCKPLLHYGRISILLSLLGSRIPNKVASHMSPFIISLSALLSASAVLWSTVILIL